MNKTWIRLTLALVFLLLFLVPLLALRAAPLGSIQVNTNGIASIATNVQTAPYRLTWSGTVAVVSTAAAPITINGARVATTNDLTGIGGGVVPTNVVASTGGVYQAATNSALSPPYPPTGSWRFAGRDYTYDDPGPLTWEGAMVDIGAGNSEGNDGGGWLRLYAGSGSTYGEIDTRGRINGNGGGLTNLNASSLATGTVAAARIGSNVVYDIGGANSTGTINLGSTGRILMSRTPSANQDVINLLTLNSALASYAVSSAVGTNRTSARAVMAPPGTISSWGTWSWVNEMPYRLDLRGTNNTYAILGIYAVQSGTNPITGTARGGIEMWHYQQSSAPMTAGVASASAAWGMHSYTSAVRGATAHTIQRSSTETDQEWVLNVLTPTGYARTVRSSVTGTTFSAAVQADRIEIGGTGMFFRASSPTTLVLRANGNDIIWYLP